MKRNTFLSKDIILHERGKVKTKKPDIQVTVRLPDHVSVNTRRQKINRIYDILAVAAHE